MARTFIAYTDHASAMLAPRRYIVDVDAFGYTPAHTALVAETMRKATAITSDVRVIVLDDEPTVSMVKAPRVSLVKTYHGRVCVECGHLATQHYDGVRCPGGDADSVLRFVLHLDDYAAGTPRVELNRTDDVWDGVEMRWSDRALVHVLGDGTQVAGDYLFACEVI